MRHWMFAFLLLALPFQLVWGAAAPYCGHEASDLAKGHLGHHSHEHQPDGQSGSPDDDSRDDMGAYHADCAGCHLGCTAVMPAKAPAVEPLPHGSTSGHREPRYDSHIPAGPQRPDRAEAAPAARFGGGVVVVSLAD